MKKLNAEQTNDLLWNVGKIQEQYYQNVMDCIESFIADEDNEDEDYDLVSEACNEWFYYATAETEENREAAKKRLIELGYME